ncbi:MAG: hypothetical protein Q8S73_09675 [Deltaproteobacteria bacterium]|nr:hypothetical protein [Myxococcales bacterium]MDP3214362.1 hypothetical protein [Deltaproteobacteria bacterium]
MSHLDAVRSDATESPPPCCGATIALVLRLGRDLVCPTCRVRYVFDRATAPAREESDVAAPVFRARPPGPPRDRRVSVVHGPTVAATRKFQRVDARELVDALERTLALLDELQVDLRRSGVADDGGRTADGPEDPDEGHGVDRARPVVQTSPNWGAVLLRRGPPKSATDVEDTSDARTEGRPEERETLRWLRRQADVGDLRTRGRWGRFAIALRGDLVSWRSV